MWRAILLGKLSTSIIASLVIGIVCINQRTNADTGLESWQWLGLGIFFLLLTVGQIAAVYFIMKRNAGPKKSKPISDEPRLL